MSETIALPGFDELSKRCTRCKITKPVEEFHRKGHGKRSTRCGTCRAETRVGHSRGTQWLENRTHLDRRAEHLKRKYGITLEQYDQMLEAQGGGCAICARAPGKQVLAVDHCHETGRVRALLCSGCNRSIGYYEYVRERATAYLDRYGRGNPLLDYDA